MDITAIWISYACSPDVKYGIDTQFSKDIIQRSFVSTVAIMKRPLYFTSLHTIQYPKQNTSNWCKKTEAMYPMHNCGIYVYIYVNENDALL